MDTEQAIARFDELHEKYTNLANRQWVGSAMKVAVEAKRFAKSNNLLMPYLHACFSITNFAQSLFEPEIGADNALEIIALVESEEKARKFQHDFDDDFYRYTIHWITACAYDNLAKHTAMRSGYNSPIVHGAVDDGILVCRRTGKLECVDCFREYAFNICLASGDYEMGEHYSRLCATSQSRHGDVNRNHVGYKQLVMLYLRQGKLAAARESLLAGIPYAGTYYDPLEARIDFTQFAERYCMLAGREAELDELSDKINGVEPRPEIPSRDENPYHALERTVNESLRFCLRNDFAAAESLLVEFERFLLGCDNLDRWFELRIQRIATLLLAAESGKPLDVGVEPLADELRHYAGKACQWSAIGALDTMLNRRVKLNPLGIASPIDQGPYATVGTPVSVAQIEWALPLVGKPGDESASEQPTDTREKSAFEIEAESWFASLQNLWREAAIHEHDQMETGQSQPFPKATELATKEREVFEKIVALTPDSITGPNDKRIDEDEFYAASQPLLQFLTLRSPENIAASWNWVKRMADAFPNRGRSLAALAFHGLVYRKNAAAIQLDPGLIDLPPSETLEHWIAKAFEMEPNRTGIATIAGRIFREHGKSRESQRYFSRATQIDRLNDFATISLAELYEESDRPKDAMATIELYTRAGGRHPGLLWNAMQIAFRNEMPDEFLRYYSTYTSIQPPYPMLDAQRIGALCRLERFGDALKALDVFDEQIGGVGLDSAFLRALCQAELGDNSWTKTFAAAFQRGETEIDGLLGTAYDPCERLWNHVAVSELSAETKNDFVRFLLQRGLVPSALLAPDTIESENEFGYYRCIVKQPLSPDVPAFAGWARIPSDDPAYLALWLVLAVDETEAVELVLESQSRCYPIPAEPFECMQLDTFRSPKSQVVAQGRRFPPQ